MRAVREHLDQLNDRPLRACDTMRLNLWTFAGIGTAERPILLAHDPPPFRCPDTEMAGSRIASPPRRRRLGELVGPDGALPSRGPEACPSIPTRVYPGHGRAQGTSPTKSS